MNLLYFLLIGVVAGWLAGQMMKGKGFGLWGNLGLGVAGSFLGGFLFGLLQIRAVGLLGELLAAVGGAGAVLWAIGKIKT